MAETKNIEVGGRLHSIATGNVLAGANEIIDDDKGKKQSVINAETDVALNDRYTKSETYNKSELNNMITTPNQQYVTVTATDQTTAATDVLPATGAANTVYRVGNWDSSQFDASVYSEYAWNGSQYIHLSTKTKIGEVFDISAYHATGGTLATYDNLNDALNGTNGGVPLSIRRGGMSVKFVLTSDNKYVQYRLMADDWSANTNDWSFCGDDVLVENSEWIYVLLDAEKRILAGLKPDGSVEWSIGIPTPVKTYIDNAIAEIKNGTEGTDLDGLNKIIAFLSELSTSDTLKDLLDSKVDKEEGKSLIDEEYANGVHYIENPEFTEVNVDADDKILEATMKDGTKFLPAGVEINGNINHEGYVTSIVENSEFLEVELDANNKILSGRKTNGTKFENIGFETPNISIDGSNIDVVDDPEENLSVLTDKDNKVISYRDKNGFLHENVGLETPSLQSKAVVLEQLTINGQDLTSVIYNIVNSTNKASGVHSSSILLRDKIINDWPYYFQHWSRGESGHAVPTEYDYIDWETARYDTRSMFPAEGVAKTLYVDNSTNKRYKWSENDYVETTVSIDSYLDEKIKEVPEGPSFIVIADTHWPSGYKNLHYIVSYIKEKLSISKVLFLGDCYNQEDTKFEAAQSLSNYANDFYMSFGEDGLFALGNHDSNYIPIIYASNAAVEAAVGTVEDYQSEEEYKAAVSAYKQSQEYKDLYEGWVEQWIIADTEVYNRTVKHNTNVVFDETGINNLENLNLTEELYNEAVAWMKLHYYCDDSKLKIRFICLESGSNGITQLRTIGATYSNALFSQARFIADALITTPNGYTPVLFMHEFDTGLFENSIGIQFCKMVSKYNAKSDGYIGFSRNFDKVVNGVNTLHYDFTNVTNTKKALIINAHWHYDAAIIGQTTNNVYSTVNYYSDDLVQNDDAVLNIVVDTDTSRAAMNQNEHCIHYDKIQNTVEEHSINVFTLKESKVYCTRIGMGPSRVFNY